MAYVMTRVRMQTFHKALQKYPSGEIYDFDVILFQIYQGIGEAKLF